MLRRPVILGAFSLLAALVGAAQSSGVQIYSLPNTGGTSQWIKLGTFNASQQGYDVQVKIVTSQGYNASIGQDQVSFVHFKSSNASSVDANGFAGDSWWYQTGPNTAAPSQIVWVANAAGTSATAFTLYGYFSYFTGNDSYYVVDVPGGTSWTNLSAAGQPNPGSGSSSVLVAQNEFYVGSLSSFWGNVGVGTTSPLANLEVVGSSPTLRIGDTHALDPGKYVGILGSLVFGAHYDTAAAATIYGYDSSPYSADLRFATATSGSSIDRMTILSTGNIGIGTTLPGTKLEINGSVKLTSGSGAALTFADGTTQSTAWTGVLCGGDYAESVDVSDDWTHYEPGDVLVLDPANAGRVVKSTDKYSTAVAGIYSTKPGLIGRRQTAIQGKNSTEIPMAMVGIVPTKVSAENGAIHPGDLLVTSSTPGYAMKGTDRSLFAGAVVGKAMGSLDSGTGVIEALVSLQ